jgi:transcriptional regulator
MYQPEDFRVDDVPQVHALMRARPFAALISAGPAGLYATHMPTVLKDEGPLGLVECHVARANPHWKQFAESSEVLMIFQGADGYVTPNWYPSKAQHGKVVPTWNYAVVHAYARPEVMNDQAWLRRHVAELSAQQEAHERTPWSLADAPERYVDVMLRGIVGIRLAVTRLEGKWKMSQNREPEDRAGVVQGFAARAEGDDLELAEMVRRVSAPSR